MADHDVPDALARHPSRMVGLLSWATIAGTVAITLPRLTPVDNYDFLTFVSVAERLRAGDRLYVDVWDNKDPYFYYALAGVGSLGHWGYYLLEVLWVGIAVLALAGLGRSQGMSRQWSLIVAGAMAPWCLIGFNYIGTMTTMPGIALVLAVLALAGRGRWTQVGLVLGLLLFLKLIFIPIAVAGAVVFCGSQRSKALLKVFWGGLASSSAGAIVIALRGELTGYVSMLERNSEYASNMVDSSGAAGFLEHLSKLVPAGEHPGAAFAAGAVVLGIALAAWRVRAGSQKLAVCAAVLAVSCAAVLGLTAVWSHHAQLLAVPGCVTLLALAQGGPPRDTRRYVGVLGVGLLAGYLLGGITPVPELVLRPARAVEPLVQLRGVSPEAESIANDDVASYARLGRNDLDAHARGLGALELACPIFHQYEFDPPSTYERTLACLPDSDVVFVAVDFADKPDARYVTFAAQAEMILQTQFECTVTEYGRKCLRRGP